MCRFIIAVVPAFAGQASGPSKMEAQCIDHEMQVPIMGGALQPDTLCPIGRIEKARDEALLQ